jgi:hypothetical protein
MAGLPLVEIYQKLAKGFGNIISGGSNPRAYDVEKDEVIEAYGPDRPVAQKEYDADIITRMIMTEAYDNPDEWEAMTNVVLNRFEDYKNYKPNKKGGKTKVEKLITGGDFDGLEDNPQRYNNPFGESGGEDKYIDIHKVVTEVLEGNIGDNTGGSTFFDKGKKGIKIGNHWYH